MNWMQVLQNPKSHVLKKFVAEVLGGRATPQYMDLMDRVGAALVTEADLRLFHQMVAEVYEVAYLKAVEDHKQKLAEMGFKVSVIPQKRD